MSPGLRSGALVGASALRVRNILPWAGLGVALEHVLETSRQPRQRHLEGGARVGFDWGF
ncbi:hypothetical protein [Sorangium sp. So ce131]|uniref:hypothetical protein n=1 Tax=Sorangium sp. So ce131 TaxID=3133282 RepID=UPI003F631AFC